MNPLWNLEKDIPKHEHLPPPTGTRREQGAIILKNCRERDARLQENALACERDGDSEGCWFAMAARAENQRLIDKILAEFPDLEQPKDLPALGESGLRQGGEAA
jgi:hypothetical protein